MTDFYDFIFASVLIGGSMLALAWWAIDNLRREFRDEEEVN